VTFPGSSGASRSPLLVTVVFGFVALLRCGGTSSTSASSARATGEIHRSSHVCPATGAGQPLACTTSSDCELDDAGLLYQGGCREGVCHLDQCLTDDDCSPGTACSCLGDYGGNGWYKNWCLTADCRADGDCGDGGVCSPSFAHGPCSEVTQGFFCHTPRDTCTTDADCGGNPEVMSCQFVEMPVDQGGIQSGHWACSAAGRCASG
jgi:hypothetical protein